jgi:integrase
VDLKTKEFDYGVFIDLFFKQKSKTTAVANSYKGWIQYFWMPLLCEKYGCQHPNEFVNFEGFIEDDIRQAKTKYGKPYSPHTYSGLTSAFNEFMKFLKKKKVIDSEAFFLVYVETDTLEQEKRGLTVSNRGKDHYKNEELYEIKKKIDLTFPVTGKLTPLALKENKKWKLRAYAIFLGCCMGLRRGNIIGLKAEDLHPENEVPHLITSDNIVVGYSRAEKGAMKLENSTKTFKGRVVLPFIQPDVDILVEVATYIKSEVKKGYLLTGGSKTGTIFPDSFNAFWRKISEKAKFRYVHPHGFKHGYASRGAVRLGDWYDNSVYFLHRCCMHSKFETTQNYIKANEKDGFLEQFKFLKKKSK